MPASLDETYAPRLWRCEECRRVLGVVMRDTSRIRKLWVFRVDRVDADVPKPFTMWGRPRGLFKDHGVLICDGVECSTCGALNGWASNDMSFEKLMSHYSEVKQKEVV